MSKINIICIDDQREVLATVKKDLEFLSPHFVTTDCETAAEADEVMNELLGKGQQIALIICDHIMPGENGIKFLTRMNSDARFLHTKKMLLTGLASHDETIQAINDAEVDAFIEKPWGEDEFTGSIRKLLTRYFVESGQDYTPYQAYLDAQVLKKFGK